MNSKLQQLSPMPTGNTEEITKTTKVENLLWWNNTHYYVIISITGLMSLWMIFNNILMINLEIDHFPIPYMWYGLGITVVVAGFLYNRINNNNDKLKDLGEPPVDFASIFSRVIKNEDTDPEE